MTRNEAIDTLKANYPDAHYSELRKAVNLAIDVLERPNGVWIKKVLNYSDRGLKEIRYECSECEMDFDFKWNYCPFCGAQMDASRELYLCDPDINKNCTKEGCFINGGPCRMTNHKEFEKEERN